MILKTLCIVCEADIPKKLIGHSDFCSTECYKHFVNVITEEYE